MQNLIVKCIFFSLPSNKLKGLRSNQNKNPWKQKICCSILMPISSPFHPFSCHCNLTKLDRCCQNQLHDSTSFCLKFTLPLYHKWSISIVLTLPDLQILFFWKLCLVTFNLRAIKKSRRGLQSQLEKEEEKII